MDYENQQKRFESVYSTKVRAGKRRTYFFDVRKTKGEDFYITLTESTKRFNSDGYERHKIFLYKEDFNRFLTSLSDAIDHVKTELMPDYDYDEFTKRQLEWEEKRALELENGVAEENNHTETVSSPAVESPSPVEEDPKPDEVVAESSPTVDSKEPSAPSATSEEDMSW